MANVPDDKEKLTCVHLHQKEPADCWHTFASYGEADSFIRKKCEELYIDEERIFTYRIEWDKSWDVNGNLVVDTSDIDRTDIVFCAVRSELLGRLLLPTGTVNKQDFRMMVNSPEWQFEKLMMDTQRQDKARTILHVCEGFDTLALDKQCQSLQEAVSVVEIYHPLLRLVFPEMRDWYIEIVASSAETHCKNSFLESFARKSSRAICAAMQDDEEAFRAQKGRVASVVKMFRNSFAKEETCNKM